MAKNKVWQGDFLPYLYGFYFCFYYRRGGRIEILPVVSAERGSRQSFGAYEVSSFRIVGPSVANRYRGHDILRAYYNFVALYHGICPYNFRSSPAMAKCFSFPSRHFSPFPTWLKVRMTLLSLISIFSNCGE